MKFPKLRFILLCILKIPYQEINKIGNHFPPKNQFPCRASLHQSPRMSKPISIKSKKSTQTASLHDINKPSNRTCFRSVSLSRESISLSLSLSRSLRSPQPLPLAVTWFFQHPNVHFHLTLENGREFPPDPLCHSFSSSSHSLITKLARERERGRESEFLRVRTGSFRAPSADSGLVQSIVVGRAGKTFAPSGKISTPYNGPF